jgi:hypothetical protein
MTQPLNSNYKVLQADKYSADVLIVLESRGGASHNARNPDYSKQLSRILRMLKKTSCTITRIDLMSTVAQNTLKDPKLNLTYPIKLSDCQSVETLRKEIQRAQMTIGQKPGASGGNGTKRIGVYVKVGPTVVVKGVEALLA